jgi:hypothetical protein
MVLSDDVIRFPCVMLSSTLTDPIISHAWGERNHRWRLEHRKGLL